MSARFLIGGLAAALLLWPAEPAHAQNSGLSPAEAPPASFQGSRFVDSRGCVFQRSTFGGQVSWVPLFGPDAKPVCDGGASVTAPAPAPREAAAPTPPAPEPAPLATVTPEAVPAPQPEAPVVAEPPTAAPPPVPQAVVVPQPEAPATGAPSPRVAAATPRRPAQPQVPARHRACPEAAPYGQLVRASDGRRLVRCVADPDRLLPASGRAVPLDPEAPLAPPPEPAPAPVASPAPAITETAPEPAAPAPPPQVAAAPEPPPLLVIDSRAAGQPFPDSSGRFVQVATFAVPENASRTRAALNAQRLPVRSQPARLGGQPVQVIFAGPFLTEADLRRALGTVRAMGFRDAFVRG